MQATNNSGFNHSFYAVKNGEGKFFAGFDAAEGRAKYVENVLEAKLFTNKFEIKLRPNEMVVEVVVSLSSGNTTVSEPFRPHRRKPVVKVAA